MTKQISQADMSDATSASSVPQNRYKDRLPCEFRVLIFKYDGDPFLLCLSSVNYTRVRLRPFGSQCSDYINASFVEVRFEWNIMILQ